MGTPKFKINGQVQPAPRNWKEVEVLATFDNSSAQANITTTELNYVNETARQIIEYIQGGYNGSTNGIFEGLPLEITVSENGAFNLSPQQVFNGLIKTTETNIISPVEIEVGIEDRQGLDKLEFVAQGLTFGLLADKGVIGDSDYINIPYVVQKPKDFLAQALLSLAIFNILRETIATIRDIAKAVADIAGGLTGVLVAAAKLIALIAYVTALIIQLTNLTTNLFEFLAPPIRYFKGMRIKDMIEKGLDYLGYQFESSISDLQNVYYLPSKGLEGDKSQIFKQDKDNNGYPAPKDAGYIFSELLQAVLSMFKAKVKIDGNTVKIESVKNYAFWRPQSAWRMPDVLRESYSYNTNELFGTKVVSFIPDVIDEWTARQFKGHVYEVKTESINSINKEYNLIGGYNETSIPFSLANRKTDLTALEKLLASVNNVVKGLENAINGITNVLNRIPGVNFTQVTIGAIFDATDRLRVMRISNEYTTIPKLIPLEFISNRWVMPENDRDRLSARYLWENYINEESFVDNNYGNQYKLYKNVKVAFTLSDFIQLISNSYIYDTDGTPAKVEKISWVIGEDYAEIDYRRQEIYTRNLSETKIEGGYDQ